LVSSPADAGLLRPYWEIHLISHAYISLRSLKEPILSRTMHLR
jgi:hypothetical protein